MLEVFPTKQFKKDLKRLRRSGRFDEHLFESAVQNLAERKVMNEKFKDHALKGNMKGMRECHLRPDLLLVYKIYEGRLILELIRLGSHSELLDM
jgi:mRNA interferase YafQ